MLKTLLTATALSGLVFSTAVAQQTPAPAPASPPAARMDDKADAKKAEAQLPADAAGKFVAAQGADHWVASKFKGTDVLGPNNEHIGDVDDMLFDKQGKILAYIVGVGGFLGIGEKNVAIEPSAFQMVTGDAARTSGAGTGTGNTGAANTATTSASGSANDPANMKLKVTWTKEQLKNAPAFEYWRAPARTTGTGTGVGGTTGTAPATNR